MRRFTPILLLIGFLLVLGVQPSQADWTINALTGKLDYYEPAAAVAAHAASHAGGGADPVDHDTLANYVAGQHLVLPGTIAATLTDHNVAAHNALAITTLGTVTVGVWNGTDIVGGNIDESTVDHDSLLNYAAGQHLVLPGTIAAVLTDHDLAAHTGLGLAPANAHYLTDQAEGDLSAEVVVTANGKALVTAANYAAMWVLLSGEPTAAVSFNSQGLTGVASIAGPAAALDINTNIIQDINFWDTIASGNPSFRLYGWNTAGGDRESMTFAMNDTNDEGVIAAANSANHEGITVKLQEANQRLRVRQNSDTWSIRLDGSDVIYHTTDGQHIFSTDEAAAAAETRWNDADDSAYVGIDSPAVVTGSWTWTLAAAVPTVSSYAVVDTSGDTVWEGNTRTVILKVYADDGGLTLADGEMHFTVPIELTGYDLVSVGAHVYTASDGGTAINISIYNLTDTSDMLSTQLTIDNTEKDSSTAATPAVIDAGEDDVVTADEIRIDVNQIGANAAGLEIRLGFRK